jgi:hypothetical protein
VKIFNKGGGEGDLCLCMNASYRQKAGSKEVILEGLDLLKKTFIN